MKKAPSLSAHSGPKCLAAIPHRRLAAACCDPATSNIGRIFIQVNTAENFPLPGGLLHIPTCYVVVLVVFNARNCSLNSAIVLPL